MKKATGNFGKKIKKEKKKISLLKSFSQLNASKKPFDN
jgi:hypothetical protein